MSGAPKWGPGEEEEKGGRRLAKNTVEEVERGVGVTTLSGGCFFDGGRPNDVGGFVDRTAWGGEEGGNAIAVCELKEDTTRVFFARWD